MEASARLLSARALTVRELRQGLSRRGYGPDEIDAAVRTLLARGYLDDGSLAYNAATSLAVRRLYGKTRIAAALHRRGVPAETIAEALERAFAEIDEDDLASRAAVRYLAPGAARGARDEGQAARALLRRGFSRGAVAKALRGASWRSAGGARTADRGDGGAEIDDLLAAEQEPDAGAPDDDTNDEL